MSLAISDLYVRVGDAQILNGLNLVVQPGELHAIMGQNGSGKSSLAATCMGHPDYTVTQGSIAFNGNALLELSPDKRAKQGLFLAFQYPHEIEGVTIYDFLRLSYNARYGNTEKQLGMKAFRAHVLAQCELLELPFSFVERPLNLGFSGGEKKRAEMLQLAVLQPACAILDEIDSGLDIDALNIVCKALTRIKTTLPHMSLIVITHYQRILHYIVPDFVHVMHKGQIVESGSSQLAIELEKKGYRAYQ